MKPNIEIHIDELVLHGFAPNDYAGISDAVEFELTRLFSEHGIPSSLSSNKKYSRIDAGEFTMPTGSKANSIGNSVAGSVYKGVIAQSGFIKK